MNYNKKSFIAPESATSMSAVHCKIIDNVAIARLSDCHGSIRWHNKLTEPAEKAEMLEKLSNAIKELENFKKHIENEPIPNPRGNHRS